MSYTPIPWKLGDNFEIINGEFTIADCNISPVLTTEEQLDNARHIVHCVNNFYQVVEALKVARGMIGTFITDDPSDKWFKRIELIEAALKSAEGERK